MSPPMLWLVSSFSADWECLTELRGKWFANPPKLVQLDFLSQLTPLAEGSGAQAPETSLLHFPVWYYIKGMLDAAMHHARTRCELLSSNGEFRRV